MFARALISFSACIAIVMNSFQANAKTIVIGTGSGTVSKNSMDGLDSGDVLAILPGTYSGGDFSNLKNISIINNSGLVVFTGTVSLGSLRNTIISGTGAKNIFYGIQFNSLKARAFTTSGNFYGLRIYNCEFINVSEYILDASDNDAKYNGDTLSIKLYKTTLANLKMVKCGVLLQGFYGTPDKLTDIIDSIAIFNIKIDTTVANGQAVAAGAIYRMDFHDWKVNNFALNPALSGDIGLIHTSGNGRVYNIYRHGGRGYIWRQWNTGLNEVAESYIYNVIDLATNAYGFIDTRIDDSYFVGGNKVPFTTGGNIHILNNTIGNKSDDRYVTPVVILGQQGGYKTEVRNNLAFNIKGFMMNNNSGKNYDQNDSSSNLLFNSTQILDVLSDTIYCLIKHKKSPIVDKGTPVPFIKTDIGGVPRPHGDGFDIGARECL
ncbi:MAG TPA: choice-of-anchor Q domain-containing protein [Puia sp.]|nr:choice-of-anchor Q domain-containing protein [Puia sp.]